MTAVGWVSSYRSRLPARVIHGKRDCITQAAGKFLATHSAMGQHSHPLLLQKTSTCREIVELAVTAIIRGNTGTALQRNCSFFTLSLF